MATAEVKRVFGTLIVAGIGVPEPFEALLKSLGGVPERLFLVEPAETPGGVLAQRFAGMEGVKLVDAVMGEAAGEVELVRYNLPGLRSTATPSDALRQLFPGLKARATLSTHTLPVAQLLDDPDSLPPPVRLRIDMPGVEGVILQCMEDCGALSRVDLLSLRCGAEAMFKGVWDRAVLQSWLEARYFKLDHADEEDPDWPELRFAPDPARRRIETLETELAEAREAAKAEVEKLRSELAASTEKAQALEAERTASEKRLSDVQKALKEHEKLIAECREKTKGHEDQVRELEHKSSQARAELRRAEGQVELIKDLLLREAGL